MRLAFTLFVLFVLFVALLVTPAGAAQRPDFTFPHEGTAVTVKWADLLSDDGAEVDVDNETGRAQTVQVVVSRLRSGDASMCPPSSRNCVSGTIEPPTMPAGGGGTITLKADETAMAVADSYMGRLAVVDESTGASASVALRVTVNAKVAAVPRGAARDVEIECRRPLHADCETAVFWVPLRTGIDAGPNGANLTLAKDQAVGNVHDAEVLYTGRTRNETPDRWEVELAINGLHEPGAWTGNVDLDTRSEEGKLTLNVTRRTALLWFVVATAGGIVVGLLVALLVTTQTVLGLRLRLQQAERSLAKAKSNFRRGGQPWSEKYDLAELGTSETARVRAEIDELQRGWFTKIPEEDRKRISDDTAAIANTAEAVDDLEDALERLQAEITVLATRCDPLPPLAEPVAGEPPITVAGEDAVYQASIATSTELDEQRKAVDGWTSTLKSWREAETGIARRQKRIHDAAVVDTKTAEDLLTTAWALLWRVERLQELEQHGFPSKFSAIDAELAKLDLPGDTTDEPDKAGRPAWRRNVATHRHLRLETATGSVASSGPLARQATRRPWRRKLGMRWKQGRLARRQLMLTSLLVLVFGFAIGFGLWKLNYDAKGWGTPVDYLASVIFPLLGEPAGMALVLAFLSGARTGRA